MALWEVIELFVSKYVKLYYDVDDKIIEDSELQNWRQEMTTEADHGGLGIYGVPGEMGKFTSRAQVTSVCAFIIFTCSVAHAAVCFKQYDEYAFPPNYPAMLLGEPPRDKTPRQEQDILNALPGRSNMVDALTILKLLSERHTKPMGEYEMNLVYDPEGIRLLEDFKQNLRALSATLKIKNRIRVPPYPFLDPCEIPNSMIP
ncbi:hypothetical protein DPMN_068900 [Dreissena polymorpha]|uniref:Lipoxygenase domain-containing protein n=2 Tax=Dreissena polymorpha TaxID=45954 RepID=A0A9D3Z336_DREPO|nr:hypothetical protein DPMN_068900 [Dreissena polymorpha]